jgi:hypothetical protein
MIKKLEFFGVKERKSKINISQSKIIAIYETLFSQMINKRWFDCISPPTE